MKEGWFIGAFLPTALLTEQFEVAYKKHKAGEVWPEHYQRKATEVNLLVSGVIRIGEQMLYAGDIFTVFPMEPIKPEFITNVALVVVKTPSLPGDKVLGRPSSPV